MATLTSKTVSTKEMTLAQVLDIISSNPALAFSVDDVGGVEKSRDRALTIEELAFTFKTFRDQSDSFTRDNYLACSLLVLLGVRKGELTEAMWNDVEGIYNRHDYFNERREALDLLAKKLAPLI